MKGSAAAYWQGQTASLKNRSVCKAFMLHQLVYFGGRGEGNLSESVRRTSDAKEANPALPHPPPFPSHRNYPNPPIKEGLVQFNFATSIPWTIATPGQVFERLQGEYPTDPEQQGVFQAGFGPSVAGGSPDFTVSQGGTRVLFRSADRSKLIVLNDQVFSVNSVPPYEGWVNLSGRITRAVGLLRDLFEFPPIASVSVRYINIIELPQGRPTDDYFEYDIRVVRGGASYLTSFMHRVESLLPDGVTSGATTFASAGPAQENVFPVLLDIEFRRVLVEDQSIDDAIRIAHELKALENAEFEGVIKEAARGLFQ